MSLEVAVEVGDVKLVDSLVTPPGLLVRGTATLITDQSTKYIQLGVYPNAETVDKCMKEGGRLWQEFAFPGTSQLTNPSYDFTDILGTSPYFEFPYQDFKRWTQGPGGIMTSEHRDGRFCNFEVSEYYDEKNPRPSYTRKVLETVVKGKNTDLLGLVVYGYSDEERVEYLHSLLDREEDFNFCLKHPAFLDAVLDCTFEEEEKVRLVAPVLARCLRDLEDYSQVTDEMMANMEADLENRNLPKLMAWLSCDHCKYFLDSITENDGEKALLDGIVSEIEKQRKKVPLKFY